MPPGWSRWEESLCLKLVPCRLQLWMAALVVAPLLPHGAALAQPPLQVPLECQLQHGQWQPCKLTVVQVGEHWWLQIGRRRLEFRSDGRGSVILKDAPGASKSVQPVWTTQRALCWDGVCTKGDLPLD